MYVCMYVCMYLCTCVCVCVSIYIYIHTHTQTHMVCLKHSVNGTRKQTKDKLTLLAFKIIAILHNTLLATFIKLLETVSKSLFRNRSQNRSHTFLDPKSLQTMVCTVSLLMPNSSAINRKVTHRSCASICRTHSIMPGVLLVDGWWCHLAYT
jgi:hypothetical protein